MEIKISTANNDGQTKNPWLAVFLSFLLPGLGQIYCKKPGQGVLIITLMIIFALSTIFLLQLLAIALYFYALVNAYNLADSINAQITEQKIKQEEDLRIQEQKKQQELRDLQKNFVHINDFKEKLIKYHKLLINGIISQNEYNSKKSDLFNELNTKSIDSSREDFLYELIELKDNSIINTEELNLIKSII